MARLLYVYKHQSPECSETKFNLLCSLLQKGPLKCTECPKNWSQCQKIALIDSDPISLVVYFFFFNLQLGLFVE